MSNIQIDNKKRLLEGFLETCTAVGKTMGSEGSLAIYESEIMGLPIVTKDGISVAKSMFYEDKHKAMGNYMAKQSALRTVLEVGDAPQPLYSKVLTPNGWVKMGDLKEGDIICGTDNTTQRVLGIYPKGEREIVKVTFLDGRVVECCDEHLWTVLEEGVEKTLMTKILMENPTKYSIKLSSVFLNSLNDIAIKYLGKDIKSEINFSAEYPLIYASISERDNNMKYLSKFNDKGLIDFTTKSINFRDTFINLCRSLGKKVTSTLISDDTYRIQELKSNSLEFSTIERTGVKTEMQCIKVSNENSLYITDDYVPTHNTTTSLVLAKGLVENTLKRRSLITPSTYNKKVENGFDVALADFKQILKDTASKTTDTDIKKIATISANNNKEIGELILKAYKAVGKDGVIDFKEDPDRIKTEVEITNGMLLPKGMISPLLRNKPNGNFEAEDALVIIYNGFEAGKSKEVFDFINSNKNKSIILIVERLQDEDFVRRLATGNQNGFDLTIIESPLYDTDREMLLEDIALYTGGKVFVQGTSSEITPGKLDRLIVTSNTTSLIKKNIPQEAKDRAKELEVELKNTNKKDILKRRIQLLKGVASTIQVGAPTESERREIFDRVEDAVHAVRASVEEGWVAGGGSTFVYIAGKMNKTFKNKDEQHGYNIVKKSLLSPFIQICDNANRNYKDYISACNTYGYGYNAVLDEISNLIDDGVIDSVKSLRVSLENAISVAKMVSNIKVVVSLK